MHAVARLFTGLILVGGLGSGAFAADNTLTTRSINDKLERLIEARMNRELRARSPFLPALPGPSEGNRVTGPGVPAPAGGQCPCFKYVYQWKAQEPVL